jgi:hypothetical protein
MDIYFGEVTTPSGSVLLATGDLTPCEIADTSYDGEPLSLAIGDHCCPCRRRPLRDSRRPLPTASFVALRCPLRQRACVARR